MYVKQGSANELKEENTVLEHPFLQPNDSTLRLIAVDSAMPFCHRFWPVACIDAIDGFIFQCSMTSSNFLEDILVRTGNIHFLCNALSSNETNALYKLIPVNISVHLDTSWTLQWEIHVWQGYTLHGATGDRCTLTFSVLYKRRIFARTCMQSL